MSIVDPAIGSVLALVLIIVGIAVVVFVVLRLGSWMSKVLIGIAVNSVLGFVLLLVIGYLFDITVKYTTALVLSVALFGLPAVGTILLLKIVGGIALSAQALAL